MLCCVACRWAMEELSRALSIAVVSARMMYGAEYNQVSAAAPSAATTKDTHGRNTSGAPAAATVQRAASTPAAVVIELPVSGYNSSLTTSPSTAQQQSQTPPPPPETTQAATAAAPVDVPPALVGKSPEQLQQLLGGIMMPVQISIARDTWVTWKKGALALTPVRPAAGVQTSHLTAQFRTNTCCWITRSWLTTLTAFFIVLLSSPSRPLCMWLGEGHSGGKRGVGLCPTSPYVCFPAFLLFLSVICRVYP